MSAWIRILFFVGDLTLFNATIIVSRYLTTGSLSMDESQTSELYLVVFSNIAWLFLVMVSTPYNVSKGWAVSRIVKGQLAFVFIHLIVVAALVTFFKKQYPVSQVIYIYTIFVPLLFIFRVVTFYLRKLFGDDVVVKNYVLIGKNQLSSEVRRFFLMNRDAGYRFKGYIDFEASDFSIGSIQKFCVDKNIQEIYYCVPDVSEKELQQLVNFGLDSLIKVKVIVSSAPGQQSLRMDAYDRLPGVGLVAIALDSRLNQLVKRLFDITFSTIFCLLVMTWLIPLVGLLIKLESRGPIFFVQLRNGEGNRPFKCLKFRSMRINSEANSMQAIENDLRITKLGQVLRRTSIDELPQFINVLIGDMSVVGPRPHMLRHTEDYSKLIEKFMGRQYIKPGITGLAQCMGYRGETRELADMENRVRLDRYYIENWTFWLDIKIIFLTVVSLIRGSDKAY
jgi:putative colanic acid biosysnthesis UDP-glucose lipid carrier transferase